MKKIIRRMVLKPIMNHLRDEIDFYTSVIDGFSIADTLHDEIAKKFYEKEMEGYKIRQSEVLKIWSWISARY